MYRYIHRQKTQVKQKNKENSMAQTYFRIICCVDGDILLNSLAKMDNNLRNVQGLHSIRQLIIPSLIRDNQCLDTD